MPIDLISAELAENTFVALGDKLDEKFGKKSWVKPLYWMTVIGLFFSNSSVLLLVMERTLLT